MMRDRLELMSVAVLTAWVLVSTASYAADPGAKGAPVHGSDVMDGKDKPGQDGWSWAPTPRDQAASKSGETPGGGKSPETGPTPTTHFHLPPGQDPGTPSSNSDSHTTAARAGGRG